jgi:parvulin-like peptidyl-prolyl isomerase
VEISIDEDALTTDEDELRSGTDVVARFGHEVVTWGEIKQAALAAKKRAQAAGGKIDPVAERVETVGQIIDKRIMAQKARAAGLDRDPGYQARYDEYKKTHLINIHRERLLAGMAPSDADIDAFFEANRSQISVPEKRKVQMVVLKTKEEAEAVKEKIGSGEISIYEAARDYSIDPNAKHTLGEMGWVAKGTGFPALDELTFSLNPDEIDGPVESPAGWHLVKVLDEQSAQNNSVADENTRKLTRRKIMHDRLDKYVVNLRLNDFKVVVYQDRLNDMFKKEAAWVAKLEEKAKEPGSLTQKRTEEMKKLLKP